MERILVPLRLARASHAGGCDGGRRWKFGRADSREAEAGARGARPALDRDIHDQQHDIRDRENDKSLAHLHSILLQGKCQ